MKDLSHKTTLSGVKILATAQFSADMAQNLLDACQQSGCGNTVALEISTAGVWCRTDAGFRLFIGSTTPVHKTN